MLRDKDNRSLSASSITFTNVCRTTVPSNHIYASLWRVSLHMRASPAWGWLAVLFVSAAAATCPGGCTAPASGGCLCPDGSGTWAGGASLLGAGATWDAGAQAVALPPLWPPPYVKVPPLYLGSSPGFTLTAWVWVTVPGPVWALGTAGPSDQPSDWASARADYLRIDVGALGTTLSWAQRFAEGGTGAFAHTCAGALQAGWMFVAVSLQVSAASVSWAMRSGAIECSGTTAVSVPARWWTTNALGGGIFAGWIANAAAYDDVALSLPAMAALAVGNVSACGRRPAPAPAWVESAQVAATWASTLAPAGCADAATGAATPCSTGVAVNGWPAKGGCGANAVFTGGGLDAYPALTLDLGATKTVERVRLYAATAGGDPYASYAVLVGDVAPPAAGEPLTQPFPVTFANAPCVAQDPGATMRRGRVADFACGARGRYVTLQLLASDAGDGVLGVCQLQAFTVGASTTPNSTRLRVDAPALAAVWDVAHRYAVPHAVVGNRLADEGVAPPIDGAMTGVVQAADGRLLFNGSQPCVRFDRSPLPTAGNYSIVARFNTPAAYVPFTSTVVWEGSATRLFLNTNATVGAAMLGFAYGNTLVKGGSIPPLASVAVAIVCSGGSCTLMRD